MGRLVKLLVVIALIAVAGYALVRYSNSSDGGGPTASDRDDQRPRLEEKYGFTSETAGD